MSDDAFETIEGPVAAPEPDGELVHWMEPRPLRVGATGLSATAGVAFTVGVLATVVALALAHWLGPEREVPLPRRRREPN
jgi:hypothetical protein